MRTPTLEEAQEIISEWPDQDEFVNMNFTQFLTYGEYDDNSIELSQYWSECKKLIG